jgi:hypothetical protein
MENGPDEMGAIEAEYMGMTIRLQPREAGSGFIFQILNSAGVVTFTGHTEGGTREQAKDVAVAKVRELRTNS